MRKLSFCFGSSRQSVAWHPAQLTIEELWSRLETPLRTPETVAQYHKMAKSEKDAIKDKGGFVAGTLKEKSTPERTLKIEAIGETDVISGIGVYIVIPALGLNTTYYVDEDTHTFSDNYHKMSVTLNLANDAEYDRDWTKTQSSGSSSGSSSGGNYKVGDIVNFKGGYHYVSSDAKSATGGKRSAGKAKITYTNKGAKHPYHLVGGAYTNVDGNCNVYGWVDSDTFS